MRNMSFMLTKPQMRDRSKVVTRRDGWDHVKVGEVVMAVEKCQGLKKGEKIVKIHPIRITDKRREPLTAITPEECALEGFPDMTPDEFIAMYCKANNQKPDVRVNRIAFEHLDNEPSATQMKLVEL
jgi:hypothetical protein